MATYTAYELANNHTLTVVGTASGIFEVQERDERGAFAGVAWTSTSLAAAEAWCEAKMIETTPPPPVITADEIAALHAAREALRAIEARALELTTFGGGVVYRSADDAGSAVFRVLTACRTWGGAPLTDGDVHGYAAADAAADSLEQTAGELEAPAGELEGPAAVAVGGLGRPSERQTRCERSNCLNPWTERVLLAGDEARVCAEHAAELDRIFGEPELERRR